MTYWMLRPPEGSTHELAMDNTAVRMNDADAFNLANYEACLEGLPWFAVVETVWHEYTKDGTKGPPLTPSGVMSRRLVMDTRTPNHWEAQEGLKA